jgi:hypothetical protein
LLPWIAERGTALQELEKELDRLGAAQEAAMLQGLPFQLDKQTLSGMYARLLARLERIDPLRLPRRILSYPFRLLREKFGGSSAAVEEAEEIRELWDLKEEAFVNLVLDLEVSLVAACARFDFAPPALPSEGDLRERFRAFQSDFQNWIREQAEALAGTLTVGQRVRFYVAQALVLGALVGVEVQTGGILTMTEVLTGGVVSPFAAKLIGMALSAEESRRFQEKIRAAYLERSAALMKEHTDPVRGAVVSAQEETALAKREAEELVRTLEAVRRADDA